MLSVHAVTGMLSVHAVTGMLSVHAVTGMLSVCVKIRCQLTCRMRIDICL